MECCDLECPLCMEPLEIDDVNFYPCSCGYQVCRFCWHRIRTDENGLCPACRKRYTEDPASYKPPSQDEIHRILKSRKHKDIHKKQKPTENRSHLANVRVVQKSLVFIVGLSNRLANAELLSSPEYFGKFGKILKIAINSSTNYAGPQGPSASAYITYQDEEDAFEAIRAVNDLFLDGRALKASLGTTKYCTYFLKNTNCPKTDCMYLHALDNDGASFTKEEMQAGKHIEYEQMLLKKYEEKRKTKRINNDKWPGNSYEETTAGPDFQEKSVANDKKIVNGTISPAGQAKVIPPAGQAKLNGKPQNDPESWDDELLNFSNLRPIGAEHKATSSVSCGHTDSFPSPYQILGDLKPMTADVAGGLGLSNLHIHDNVGGLSTEDDLGFDPWSESRKGLEDIIQNETFGYREPIITKQHSPQMFGNDVSVPSSVIADPSVPQNCIPTPEEMEFLRNWKAGLQALLPNINISFSDTFSPPTWHLGDTNGSSSLSYNIDEVGFKPFNSGNNSQAQRIMRPPPGFQSQNTPFFSDSNMSSGFLLNSRGGSSSHHAGSKDTQMLMTDLHDNAVLGVYGRSEANPFSTNALHEEYLRPRVPGHLDISNTDSKGYSLNFHTLEQNRNNSRTEVPR